jgi:hypothetical protein
VLPLGEAGKVVEIAAEGSGEVACWECANGNFAASSASLELPAAATAATFAAVTTDDNSISPTNPFRESTISIKWCGAISHPIAVCSASSVAARAGSM